SASGPRARRALFPLLVLLSPDHGETPDLRGALHEFLLGLAVERGLDRLRERRGHTLAGAGLHFYDSVERRIHGDAARAILQRDGTVPADAPRPLDHVSVGEL